MRACRKWFQRSVTKQLPRSCDNKISGEDKTENKPSKKKHLLSFWPFKKHSLSKNKKFIEDIHFLDYQKPTRSESSEIKFRLGVYNKFCGMPDADIDLSVLPEQIGEKNQLPLDNQMFERIDPLNEPSNLNNGQQEQQQKGELKKLPEINIVVKNICESPNNLSVLSDPDRVGRKIRRNWGRTHKAISNMMKNYNPENIVPYEPVSPGSISSEALHTVTSTIFFAGKKDIISSTKREDDDTASIKSLACAKLSKNSTTKHKTNLISKATTKKTLNETYIVKLKETNSNKPSVVALLKKGRDGQAPDPSNEMAWYPDQRPTITSKKIVMK